MIQSLMKCIRNYMTTKRYAQLMKDGTGLTQEELKAGWHFCVEWDGLLIGPGMPEMECCSCK